MITDTNQLVAKHCHTKAYINQWWENEKIKLKIKKNEKTTINEFAALIHLVTNSRLHHRRHLYRLLSLFSQQFYIVAYLLRFVSIKDRGYMVVWNFLTGTSEVSTLTSNGEILTIPISVFSIKPWRRMKLGDCNLLLWINQYEYCYNTYKNEHY